MLGFLFGSICLLALVKVVKGRHFHGSWRRTVMRRVFERLDTTPGQEKVLFAAAERLEQAFGKVRETVKASRSTVADSVRGERFDGASVNESFTQASAALDELKKEVVEALSSVHEALRPEQRRELADLLAYGPRAGYRHGCGGGWHHGPRARWASHGGGAVHL